MHAFIAILVSLACFTCHASAEQQRIRVPTEPGYPLETGFHAVDGKSDRGGGYILERAAGGKPQRDFCFDRREGSKNKGRLLSGALHYSHDGAKVLSNEETLEVFKRFEAKLIKYHGKTKYMLLKSWAIGEKDPPEDLPEAKDFSEQLTTMSILQSIQKYHEKKSG